ncbi:hypothetical protein pb186bvf_001295 [Paramecium bursaria]
MQQESDNLLPPVYEPPQNLDNYDNPAEFFCPKCKQKRISVLKYEPGKSTWICCCCLCLSTVLLALLPFYVRDCQDITHICPACSTVVDYIYLQEKYSPLQIIIYSIVLIIIL